MYKIYTNFIIPMNLFRKKICDRNIYMPASQNDFLSITTTTIHITVCDHFGSLFEHCAEYERFVKRTNWNASCVSANSFDNDGHIRRRSRTLLQDFFCVTREGKRNLIFADAFRRRRTSVARRNHRWPASCPVLSRAYPGEEQPV